MKRKIWILTFTLLLVITTGCGKEKEIETETNTGINSNSTVETSSKGKCSVMECIQQINYTNTLEEVNKIIGFDGELTDENYDIYYWKLSENSGVKVAWYNSPRATITADFDRTILSNSKVYFSKYDELQPKIKEGITYDEFKKYIGGTDGNITEKTSLSTKYTWVDSNGGYLTASFSNSDSKCTFASGRFK